MVGYNLLGCGSFLLHVGVLEFVLSRYSRNYHRCEMSTDDRSQLNAIPS